MRYFKKVGLLFVLAVMSFGVIKVSADVLQPTLTKVFFTNNGAVYTGNVDYEVKCYGYTYDFENWEEKEPGTYTPEEVYSYSASCAEYGCEIYEPYYLNYRHIDYCDLIADTDDGQFMVEKYATSPLPDCDYIAQFDVYDGENYYRYDEGYDACIDETSDFMTCDSEHRVLIPDSEIMTDDNGMAIERSCSLAVDFVTDNGGQTAFSDVDISNVNYDAINYVQEKGIVEGYDDGTYKPGNRINRAEFTKILVEAVYDDSTIESCIADTFSDVPADEWYSKYICTALENGIVQGYPDGSFQPANDINFVESAKIIVEAFDYLTEDLPGADWYTPYVNVLEDHFAIPTTINGYASFLTRGEMAEIVYRLKEGILDKSSVYPSLDW